MSEADPLAGFDPAFHQPVRLQIGAVLANVTDAEFARLKEIAGKNQVFRSFIGLGYSDTIVPSVIRRMVFENPGWYTPYTPYQAEIAQGRLESLLNFQTMVSDLTGMAVANASLLDEGTAAGEAMTLLHRIQGKKLGAAPGTFLVSDRCFPQTIEVLKSRAEPLGITLPAPAARYDDAAPVTVDTSWSPEPVPPPVYVGKAKAPSRPPRVLDLTKPGEWTAALDDSGLDILDEGPELEEILERRRVAGDW